MDNRFTKRHHRVGETDTPAETAALHERDKYPAFIAKDRSQVRGNFRSFCYCMFDGGACRPDRHGTFIVREQLHTTIPLACDCLSVLIFNNLSNPPVPSPADAPACAALIFLYVLVLCERERAADGDVTVAEESPPTHRARSRTQVRVARVTAMEQKRHGLFSVMMRLSL